MEKYICVHGHFYQPPRENAWLEKIEYQDSAAPYHDWNERISHECYGPNGVSRILNEDKRIVDIVNNYARMSFNFGPTLLSWLEINRPDIYESILEADKESKVRFGGHGSAMAQVYNHLIMPLANRRDKETQVIWGIKDFESRFGRKPEGMWLAETAVDTETLEVLAEQGIIFTVLAPRQAKRFKPKRGGNWQDGIDPKRPYLCKLPSGKSINLFFYDGDRSQAVAFKGLLKDGKEFANYLVGGFDNRQENQLVHIATDGESYGHHHRYGDMALAYCIRYIEDNNLAKITNYGLYLELNPPTYIAEIHDNSSWSCVHGVERWKANCGCNSGGRDWHQEWRAPLREALDYLRGELAIIFENQLIPYTRDPWKLRNEYIDIILQRTPENVNNFLTSNFGNITDTEKTHIMRLLEMQRHELLMYTSCGWFFDEISGIETVQILQYACRAIQLARSESGIDLEPTFLNHLERAPSNLPEYGNGRGVYNKHVEGSKLSLTQIGMHYAVASLYAEDPDEISVFNYSCKATDFRRLIQGNQRLVVGRTHVRSKVTLSEKNFSFIVLYFGQHHFIGKAFEQIPREEYLVFVDEVIRAFKESNFSKVIELFSLYPDQRNFSFFDMFKDEQIKMLKGILDYGLDLAASSYKKINDRNYNVLNVMRSTHLELPSILVRNLEVVLNNDLRNLFNTSNGYINIRSLSSIIEEIKKWKFEMDHKDLNFICSQKLDSMLEDLGELSKEEADDQRELLINLREALILLRRIGVKPELNNIQDVVFKHLKTMNGNVPDLLKQELLTFAEYINFDVNLIMQPKVSA
jgi:alpha-amylase/alpha-mannosidase (GH57 family)